MKLQNVFILLCLIPLFDVNFAFAQTDQYEFSKSPITTTFSTNDYRGGIQNWNIAQDNRGFIYVANNFGLLEYDGKNWRNYEVINNTRLRSVYVDADGRIYVGGQNQFGYFESNNEGNLEFRSLYDQLPDSINNLEDIWKILKQDDEILFCSYLGIISYDGKQLKSVPIPSDYDHIFQVSESLYAYSASRGLAIWKMNSFKHVRGSEILIDRGVAAIIPHQNNSLLVFLTDGGIYKYEGHQFRQWDTPHAAFLAQSGVNTAILLNNNQIAIGTQNNGLIVMTPAGEVTKHFTKDKGLDNRTVLSLFQDQFHNLWVGLNNGLSMLELSSPFSIINEQAGLPGTGYCALIHENKLFLGTSNGLFYQNANPNPLNNEAEYKMVENTAGQVYNIQNIRGNLLLAHHRGAFLIQNNKAIPLFENTGTWKFEPIPGTQKILGGTYEGFIMLTKTDNGFEVEKLNDFTESSRVFELSSDSSLFMTHGYKGVYRLSLTQDNNRIEQVGYYGKNDGFPSDMLINVFRIGNDLIFPAQRGIFQYNPQMDKFQHHEQLEKQLGASTHISELEYNYTGHIYYLSDRELGYLEKNSYGEYEMHISEFVRIKSYLSDDLENISVLDHENVIFGAKEGFIHYNPNKPYVRDQRFQTFIRRIESVTEDHQINYNGAGPLKINPEEPPSFPANFSSLKFTYAAPYFDGQEEITYQYQLENFDRNWSDWSPINDKEYTNLSQGDYVFKVRAKNVFGEVSELASYSFRVFPPWYRSKIAYALYAVALLLIFGATMLVQSEKYKQDRAQLAQYQKIELEKKDSELEAVSRQSEEKITKLKNDKLRSEIDHKNRELATTTMHLINKNEFMLSVRDTIKEIAKTGSKEGIKKLVKDIDRNMAEDEGWEQFTKHFDQVHGDFLKNIKKDHPTLTPQEIKLCAYLRMNMSSKEIANLLNISVRGVEISRYRLRKKLEISRETNLVDYMLEYS